MKDTFCESIHVFAFGFILAIGTGVTYFGLAGDHAGGQPAAAKNKDDVCKDATRWQLLTKKGCVGCDFGGCNCK